MVMQHRVEEHQARLSKHCAHRSLLAGGIVPFIRSSTSALNGRMAALNHASIDCLSARLLPPPASLCRLDADEKGIFEIGAEQAGV